MKALATRVSIIAGLLAGTGSVLAQGVVNNGPASYRFFNSPTNPGLADFSGGGVHGDELAWSWWWYRTSNDTEPRERRFNPTPNTQSYTGSSAILSDSEPLGLQWSLTWAVSAGATPGAATLISTLRVTNTGAVPLTLNLFNITNPDLGGGLAGDAATLAAPGVISIADSFSDAVGTLTFNPASVAAYTAGGPASLSALLDDDDVDNFVTSGLPFAQVTDFGVGFQFVPVTLAPGGATTASISFSIGVIPAPGFACALMPAAVLALRRRRA